jgi:hypothetical protein
MDLAVRLEADEVPFRLVGSLDEALSLAASPTLEVLANYTAFQQYRAVVGRSELRSCVCCDLSGFIRTC